MATTFTGPQHGPWGFALLPDTYVSIGYGGSTEGMRQTYPGSGVYFRAWDNTPPADHTPTTTWTQPVGVAFGDRDGYVRPVQRPGVTPAPFPKPTPDRIGPFTVDEVVAVAYASRPSLLNDYGLAQYVCDVLRRLYGEGK